MSEETKPSARQRLFDLFDAALDVQADISLFQRYNPDSMEALLAWAPTHGIKVEHSVPYADGSYYLTALTHGRKFSITVYIGW